MHLCVIGALLSCAYTRHGKPFERFFMHSLVALNVLKTHAQGFQADRKIRYLKEVFNY